MNILFVLFESVMLICAVAFLLLDPKEPFWNNVLFATLIIALVLHILVNRFAVCRGSWCGKC